MHENDYYYLAFKLVPCGRPFLPKLWIWGWKMRNKIFRDHFNEFSLSKANIRKPNWFIYLDNGRISHPPTPYKSSTCGVEAFITFSQRLFFLPPSFLAWALSDGRNRFDTTHKPNHGMSNRINRILICFAWNCSRRVPNVCVVLSVDRRYVRNQISNSKCETISLLPFPSFGWNDVGCRRHPNAVRQLEELGVIWFHLLDTRLFIYSYARTPHSIAMYAL